MSHDPYDVAWYDENLPKISTDVQFLSRPIEIVEYDLEWPRLYAREEERIRSALGDRVVRVEHVGSTSVPGLPAKPLIDIVLVVSDNPRRGRLCPAARGSRLRAADP